MIRMSNMQHYVELQQVAESNSSRNAGIFSLAFFASLLATLFVGGLTMAFYRAFYIDDDDLPWVIVFSLGPAFGATAGLIAAFFVQLTFRNSPVLQVLLPMIIALAVAIPTSLLALWFVAMSGLR